MGTSSSHLHQAMRSEAVLLVLLAAPCVVESAAAFPKAVVEANAVIKAMQESKPFTVANKKGLTFPIKKGLLAAKNPDKCQEDTEKLYKEENEDGIYSEFLACFVACYSSDWMTNAVKGTDTPSCSKDPACTKLKKACESKASWGFWEDTEMTVTIKDFPGGLMKDSTHAAYGQMMCWPQSCEGTERGSTEHTYEVKEGTTGPTTLMEGPPLTMTATTVIEKMPPPLWFYIVIVVVVLSIALTVCLIKTGRCSCCGKCCPGQPGKALEPGQSGPGYLEPQK